MASRQQIDDSKLISTDNSPCPITTLCRPPCPILPIQKCIKICVNGYAPFQKRLQTDDDESTSSLPTDDNIASEPITSSDPAEDAESDLRLPRNVQAVYLRPLRREAQFGVPSCDLQMRSYSVRNLEFFADFALRAAYYLGLPAYGPIPLPRITERWTVPRANFIYKKSQENFERKTLRRLIQIKDGHPETVEIWLAFLRKHAYYGIGMKANIWEYNKLGVGKTMDVSMEEVKRVMEPVWAHFGQRKSSETTEKVLELLNRESFRAAAGGNAPMIRPPPLMSCM